jgi:hypothetical protein
MAIAKSRFRILCTRNSRRARTLFRLFTEKTVVSVFVRVRKEGFVKRLCYSHMEYTESTGKTL